ncbi:MAG: N-acetyl-gamma-glutamyl-phosphate reductase [Isosphaera sp.]|nr:N-acetyl-gamma-glutamyl-phosphate reductase [Isosphaera sp.]
MRPSAWPRRSTTPWPSRSASRPARAKRPRPTPPATCAHPSAPPRPPTPPAPPGPSLPSPLRPCDLPGAARVPETAPSQIPVAVVGPTGYTGLELIELLCRHPRLRPAYLASARAEPARMTREFPRLAGRLPAGLAPDTEPINHDAIAGRCRLAFLCLPHEAAMEHAPQLLRRGVKVVDLSAAYRLKDPAVYAAAYGHAHTDPAGLARAVYGLPELFGQRLSGAALVANPGCYPTAAALTIAPLLRDGLAEPSSPIVYAASGVSGAGREPKPHLTLAEAGENFSAYGIGVHRHQPEIEQSLRWAAPDQAAAVRVLFLPHLLPIERGILETIVLEPARAGLTTADVTDTLRRAYAGHPLVVVRDEAPAVRDAQRTARVHVNARLVGGRIVAVAAIDNLAKGAAAQAVQNANILMGIDPLAGVE